MSGASSSAGSTAVTVKATAADVAAVAVVEVGVADVGASAPVPLPAHLLLQWHITERCNLRCTHCYQESYSGPELVYAEWLGILAQLSLAPNSSTHITLTGGEPLLHPACPDLLAEIAARRPRLSFALLTNGLLLDAPLARRLRAWNARFVQVSLEGDQATHDRIRGAGTFARAVAAIEALVKAGVRTLIAFTAHRGNYREFPAVARLGRRLRVARVWADRLVPWGSGAALRAQCLTPEETREFCALLRCEQQAARRTWLGRTEIAMHRALQFLASPEERPYHCTAGETLLTLLPNGDVCGCRRLPVVVGNVRQTPLRELYQAPFLHTLRATPYPAECAACPHAAECRGGARCLSYALTGDPFRPDPGCWIVPSL